MQRVALGGLAVALVAGFLIVWIRGSGISAVHAQPWRLEATAARAAWQFLVPTTTRRASNPVKPTPEVLKAAREHWADHCASCHGNDGGGDTAIGRRMYPRTPDMRAKRTQDLSDGELFYAIEQGIPWTAMPGWTNGTAAGANESWALVHFVRRLPSITPEELNDMERFNPKAPPNEEQEREIDDFLKGVPPPTER